MLDLLDKVAARGAEILAGQTFSQPAADPCALRWFTYLVPPKRFTSAQGKDFPFGQLWIGGGSEQYAAGVIQVHGWFGIYVPHDQDGDGNVDGEDNYIAAAESDIERLITAVRSLGANRDYAPYSLQQMVWALGDKDGPFVDVTQGHYFLSLVLDFQQEMVLNNNIF